MEDKKAIYRKKKMLEALGSIAKKRRDKKAAMPSSSISDLKSKNIAKGSLDKDVLRVKNLAPKKDLGKDFVRVSGGSPKISDKKSYNTNINEHVAMREDLSRKQDIKKAKYLADKNPSKNYKTLRKLSKGVKSVAKKLPVIGAIASLALDSNNATAAIPGLDSSESVGMSAAKENQMIAETQAKINYNKSKAKKDRLAALAAIKGE